MDENKKIRIAMDRLHSYERAMLAGRLVTDEFFLATDEAVRNKDEKLFKKTCRRAEIPEELADHMWRIVDAAWETVYAKQSPFPLW